MECTAGDQENESVIAKSGGINITSRTNLLQSRAMEQLENWKQSEISKTSVLRPPAKKSRVQFHENDMFLSACLCGDKSEIKELLEGGVNINAASIDGVTALHQAAIDGNIDILSFLLENGADINAQDNECWTALMAAVCCGHLDIVKFLCEQGAQLNLINCDQDLALDLAVDDDIRSYLEAQLQEQGIDNEKCRNVEFKSMMEGSFLDKPHPKTGASALHVAASKGYNRLIGMLIKAGANVHERMENGADSTLQTNSGQDVLAVVDKDIADYVQELFKSFNELRSAAQKQQQQKSAVIVEAKVPATKVADEGSSADAPPTLKDVSPLNQQLLKKVIEQPPIVTNSAELKETTTSSTPSSAIQSDCNRSPAMSSVVNISSPPTQPIDAKESESERKAMSKLKRQSRRSTQGVTQDQLNELQQSRASHRHGYSVIRYDGFPRLTKNMAGAIQSQNDGVESTSEDQSSVCSASTLSTQSYRSKPSVDANGREKLSSSASFVESAASSTSAEGKKATPHHGNLGIDYRSLYDCEKRETERLRAQIKQLERIVEKASENKTASDVRGKISLFSSSTNGGGAAALTTKLTEEKSGHSGRNTVVEDDRDRRIRELEAQLQQMAQLQTDYGKLRNENLALVRVLTKLSK